MKTTMPLFSNGVPRCAVLSVVLAVFVLVPPEVLGHGPDICVWKHLFHLTACPACGSTRALAAFFHGHFTQALAYNRNVLVTGPLMMIFLVQDFARLLQRFVKSRQSG